MKFDFIIPTPDNCVSCPFKDVHIQSGKIKLECVIDRSIDLLDGNPWQERNKECPGTVEENE